MQTEFLCISVLRVASGPRVVGRKSALVQVIFHFLWDHLGPLRYD